MRIYLGSENPVKINAVIAAASETWPDVQVIGCNVPSGVNDQPLSDAETKTGALNRARAALEDGLTMLKQANQPLDEENILGLGLEGGVEDVDGEMWSTVWGVVVDSLGNEFFSNGARFKIDELLATRIRAGQELGPIISQIAGESQVNRKQGFIGIATNNFIDRTEEYASIAKLTIGLWYGRHWKNKLAKQTGKIN